MGEFLKFLVFMILLALLIAIYNGSLDKFGDNLKDEIDTMKSHVGDEIVLIGDTLIVTNYSAWDNEYTLSNGTTVARNLVENGK